jgi:predicted dehydrogenase/threonine dehydrogenase-like Zn-dependent dehydrogenase
MKQVLQNLRTGETGITEVPVPSPRPGTLLVQTAASLVSAGTERMVVDFAGKSLLGKARARPDLVRQVLDKARREGLLTTIEAAFNRLDQPMPLGYSSAGTIIALGEGVQGWQEGQRVACAGGNAAVHAEYGVVPVNLVAALPDAVDFEQAAFVTLGAIALHGFRLAKPQLGERVAIIGLGLLGLLSVGIARAAGCAVLGIDLDPGRVELARQLGAEAVVRSQAQEAAASFSRGRGCDVVLICADTPSADPVELAGLIARDRAAVVAVGAVGLHLPRKVYYEKELSFINSRSYGPGRYDPGYEEHGQDYPIGYVRWTEGRNLEAIVDLLAQRRLDVNPLISHRFPIEQASEAYELITGKTKEPFLGVLLKYPDVQIPRATRIPTGVAAAESVRTGSTTQPVWLGVLGAGNFAAAVMLPAVRKTAGIEPVGVVSASGVSARHAADKFGFKYAGSDATQVLDDPAINTVAILTRHHLHASQTAAALMAGKHVFCEKPLALNREELEWIGGLLTGSSPLLMVGFNRRFAPLAVRLKAFLDGRQEPLAAHYRVNAGYIPLNHWVHDPAVGGGRIIGEGCHFIDFLTFLVGSPPVSVTAHALPDAGRYCQDNVVMTFNFPDGSLGTVSYLANGDKAFPKERLEVLSAGRAAVLDDYRSLELIQDGRRQMLRARLRQDKGHTAEWQAFAAAISAGGPPPIPYGQLLGVHRAVFAALESLKSGKSARVE